MKSQLNDLIEHYADAANKKVNQGIDLIRRCWPILTAVLLSVWLLMPTYDMQVLFRLVTVFTVCILLGWGAGRLFWGKRTKDLNGVDSRYRDGYYTAIICASLYAAATASL